MRIYGCCPCSWLVFGFIVFFRQCLFECSSVLAVRRKRNLCWTFTALGMFFFSSRNDGSLNPARKFMPCQHFLSPLGTRSRRSALCWFYGPGFKPLLLPYCGGVAGLPPFLPPPPSVPPRPPANTFTHSGLSAILPRAAASRSLSFRPVGERRRTGMHFLSFISFCFVLYRRGTRDGENIVGTFY